MSKNGKTNTRRSPLSKQKQRCAVEERCGACQLLSLDYSQQLEKKQKYIESLFEEAAVKDKAQFASIIGMDDPFHYRNKVISPFAPGRRISKRGSSQDRSRPKKKGRDARSRRADAQRREILCGMYAKGSHHIIATDDCLIENQVAKRVILAIRDIMPSCRVEPYDEDSGRGFLRHAVVRVGHESGEVLVTLVTNGEDFPGAKRFCRELARRVPEITTIVQNVNTRNTNVILGDGKQRTLYGPGFILDRLCGLSFRISSHSFYQVNAVQTEVLYRKAIDLANLSGIERILDAYCGTGTIGLVAAASLKGSPISDSEPHPSQKRDDDLRLDASGNAAEDQECDKTESACVIGVDNVAQAIRDARNNAKHNGIDNAEFFAQDAGEFMHEMADRKEHIDVLFMDPPRAGASDEFLRATAHLKPSRIVYISCNPKTQVRDVEKLQAAGYRLMYIQPVDMFPHTDHIECIAVLELAPSER